VSIPCHLKSQDTDIHITIEGRKALNIKEEATHSWRKQHDIPGTESLAGIDASRRNTK
jgi:hypothetical protein